jgi:hypothetical protein
VCIVGDILFVFMLCGAGIVEGFRRGLLWYLARRRARAGLCRCGYDIGGLESERCPECGVRIGG